MKHDRRFSLHGTILLALGILTASIVLGATALHGIARYKESQRTGYRTAAAVSRLLATQLTELLRANDVASVRRWASQTTKHTTVLALAVFHADGTPLASAARRAELKQILLLEGQTAAARSTARIVSVRPEPQGPLRRAYVITTAIHTAAGAQPHAVLRLLLLNQSEQPADMLGFYLPLVLVAATGLILAAFWLHREVIAPLELLSHLIHKPAQSKAPKTLLTDRAEEIRRIAQAVQMLRLDLDQWRRRASELHKTMSSRVAAETRSIALALRQAKRQIWTDPLTQLHNRRLLNERLGEIFEAQRRAGQDLAIVMMDIDNFKAINDTLGHQAGDEMLRFAGELLRTVLRTSDIAVRFGGDEFVLILPSVTAEDAARIARRIVALFGQRTQLMDITPKPSLSAGVASIWQNRPADADELIRLADEALYEAKRAGKATVRIHPQTAQPIAL